ncbi:D-alanyl-D-alanine endopeptidase [Noviherbaspirillum aridicola]|uniref:D-alanyl-D-alanine endopeptidase n=1 Tax=Noviherbaspirillum aridicola TaxID=2849687 RepID=A0ABQ4Q0Q4_9BURK|nr:D-alanyl-D-alanine endopeptidase [Noviherbaspirillum aridicola]GIZ50621.1 D-alanyl-D-alanine endopeptidase [Noviherbaspirillum aridicola]
MVKYALGVFVTLFALAASSPVALAQAPAKTKKAAVKTAARPAAKARAKAEQPKKASRKLAAAKPKAVKGKEAPVSLAKRQTKAGRLAKAPTPAPVQRVSFAPSPAPAAAAPLMTAGDMAGLHHTRDPLSLASNAAFVIDQHTSQVLFEKNATVALPVASLTKLMTALVVVEANQNMEEMLEVTSDDIDREKHSGSRLRVGAHLSRADMLHIALMSSENRAASALGRHYPGGLPAFVAAMNARARSLGMTQTHYVDPTGLSSNNVSSARDLAKLVAAAYRHPAIRHYSTYPRYAVDVGRSQLHYMNSNRLVMNPDWDIGLQKTGYISEAGRCLVMQARIDGRPVIMVFLDSKGKDSRLADAGRVRRFIESGKTAPIPTQAAATQS